MEFLYTKGKTIYAGDRPILLRGMGLGGWLLPEGYMWRFPDVCDRPRRFEALIEGLCGSEYAESFWKRYRNTYITEKDIRWIAFQGLNSVRLPMNARHLFEIAEDGDISFVEQGLNHVDHCIEWCRENGLYVILDMHAAPGGQTGTEIDDSVRDIPELFTDPKNQERLVEMWGMLADRYASEPAVGGYDLLNEPIPDWNRPYNPQLLPLYRRIIERIRNVDSRHLIILEGAHWATDFSVFDAVTREEAADGLVFQFHKYWSTPDEESIQEYLDFSERVNAPLWMGEGGENNGEWYSYAFSMYERKNIGWCFWSYKKMDTTNSPVSVRKPEDWEKITDYLKGGETLSPEKARALFDAYLDNVSDPDYIPHVVDLLLHRVPAALPAAAYAREKIQSKRTPGVLFRMNSRVSICFEDGHTGEYDWKANRSHLRPSEEKILVRLESGDAVSYRITHSGAAPFCIHAEARGGRLVLSCAENVPEPQKAGENTWVIAHPETDEIWLTCIEGPALLERIDLIRAE